MFFYRTLILVVAALGLSTMVFADDDMSNAPPSSTQDTTVTKEQTVTKSESVKVNLNTASVDELSQVKGLSKVKAKNIVSYRKKHGMFTTVDDVSKVRGFKKVNTDEMQNIKDQLTVE